MNIYWKYEFEKESQFGLSGYNFLVCVDLPWHITDKKTAADHFSIWIYALKSCWILKCIAVYYP
jgi:hypothetical protein